MSEGKIDFDGNMLLPLVPNKDGLNNQQIDVKGWIGDKQTNLFGIIKSPIKVMPTSSIIPKARAIPANNGVVVRPPQISVTQCSAKQNKMKFVPLKNNNRWLR